ncbi:hypothetical protein K440DRAFT_640501 [Wilcoxina mikolae CBS 423.85]|nr:hypothetical protein K440DRAFT_640501 [Wilcoxina mikolae CBS 423.85]
MITILHENCSPHTSPGLARPRNGFLLSFLTSPKIDAGARVEHRKYVFDITTSPPDTTSSSSSSPSFPPPIAASHVSGVHPNSIANSISKTPTDAEPQPDPKMEHIRSTTIARVGGWMAYVPVQHEDRVNNSGEKEVIEKAVSDDGFNLSTSECKSSIVERNVTYSGSTTIIVVGNPHNSMSAFMVVAHPVPDDDDDNFQGNKREPLDSNSGQQRKRLFRSPTPTQYLPPTPQGNEAMPKVRRVEKYSAEKDAMIRFLRDDLENKWDNVAILYNGYWNGGGEGPGPSCLRRRYNTFVPKEARAIQRVGKTTYGVAGKGIKDSGVTYKWMDTWKKEGKLK